MRAARTLSVAMLLLSGCAVQERYYLPLDASLAREGTVCGSVPYGRVVIPLGDATQATVSVTPTDTGIAMFVQIALPLGMTVRLLQPVLLIEIAGSRESYIAKLNPFRVNREFIEPNSLLEGKGRNMKFVGPDTQHLRYDLHTSSAAVSAPVLREIILVFPAAEVNGSPHTAQRVPLRLVEKTGVMTCIQ